MSFETTKTVRELAVEIPNAARVFEKLKIDYCCGGGKSLEEACTAAGLGVAEVARLLEESKGIEVTGPDNPAAGSLTELVQFILAKHHVYTKDEMERLKPLLQKVCDAHGRNHPELFKVRGIFAQLCDDLTPHMFKEEQILFPYIMRVEEATKGNRSLTPPPFGTVRNPVRMMQAEHETAGDFLRLLRKLTNDYTAPADACISYQTLY
ncbi:MAG TPA: DUF542 domain-containing protein, partial [Pyrinomonadaceae bacterium]|nr:DUF542 domain-containing protein [Pyrinomonadaceae bacterium]